MWNKNSIFLLFRALLLFFRYVDILIVTESFNFYNVAVENEFREFPFDVDGRVEIKIHKSHALSSQWLSSTVAQKSGTGGWLEASI